MSCAEKWQRYRLRCQVCGVMFPCWMKSQPTCSKRCGGLRRIDRSRETGKMGGLASGRIRVTQAVKAMREAWPDMPDAAVRRLLELRKRWYSTGHKAGERAGYRRGWAEALGERETRGRVA